MNIIKEKWLFLNATVLHAPRQIKKLYEFGLQAISAEQVVSLRANARLTGLHWATAKSKIWRLTKNAKIIAVFPKLLASLELFAAANIVAVDFSDFGNGFQVLMFAKQTREGRALPLYFEIIRYPIPKDSQNLFVIQAIRNFERVVGAKPMLVFDRGFACPSIVRFLGQNQWKFVIRVKGGKHVRQLKAGRLTAARQTRKNDQSVEAYGALLRLVVSDRKEDAREPWYLATNDFESMREEIISRYYHRFEIEEFFRDAKRLLGLEWVSWKTETSLAVTLWFVILGVWCLKRLAEQMDDLTKRSREKMQLSETRYLFETLRTAIFCTAEAPYLHSYNV